MFVEPTLLPIQRVRLLIRDSHTATFTNNGTARFCWNLSSSKSRSCRGSKFQRLAARGTKVYGFRHSRNIFGSPGELSKLGRRVRRKIADSTSRKNFFRTNCWKENWTICRKRRDASMSPYYQYTRMFSATRKRTILKLQMLSNMR